MQRDACSLMGLGVCCVAASLVIAFDHPAAAKARRFACESSAGVPTTMAIMADGQRIPVIFWKSNVFDAAGWDPQRRCQEVSGRFDTYNGQGRLDFLTTGFINNLPVICTTPRQGGSCDGLLYTLKPGQSASETLRALLVMRTKVRGPLTETNGRLYVSMDELLSNPQPSPEDRGSSAVPRFNTAPPTSSGPLF